MRDTNNLWRWLMIIRADSGVKLFNEFIVFLGEVLDNPIEYAPDEFVLRKFINLVDEKIPHDGMRWLLMAQVKLLQGKRKEAEQLLRAAFDYATTHSDINADIILGNSIVTACRMLSLELLQGFHRRAMRITNKTPTLVEALIYTMPLIGSPESAEQLIRQYGKMNDRIAKKGEQIAHIVSLLEENGLLKDYKKMKRAIVEQMHDQQLTSVGESYKIVNTHEGAVLINRMTVREPIEEDPSVSVVFDTNIIEHISSRLADFVVFTVTQAEATIDFPHTD